MYTWSGHNFRFTDKRWLIFIVVSQLVSYIYASLYIYINYILIIVIIKYIIYH